MIVFADGATEKQKQEYERAIAYLKTSEDGRKLIEKLENAPEVILITFHDGPIDSYTATPDGSVRTIDWNPFAGLLMEDGTSIQSPALQLAHEMGHAAQHLDGGYDAAFEVLTTGGTQSQLDAEIAKIEAEQLSKYETPIAKQLGEPTRLSYSGAIGGVLMNNSTHYRTTHGRAWYEYIAPWNWGKPKIYTKDHNAK